MIRTISATSSRHLSSVTTAFVSIIVALAADGASLHARQSARGDATPPSTKKMLLACDDGSALTIEFTPGSPNRAKVTSGASTWTLPQVRTASGARYAAGDVSVWNKGNDVLFERGGTKLNCTAAANALSGTAWRLIEIQSSDDKVGIVKPDDPSKYTLALGTDGRAAMRLNCNRGTGPWSATPTGANSGSFTLGPLAVTRAFCSPPSLDDRIARDSQYIRSYLIRDGRLYLNLTADGGTYVWERDQASR